MQINSIFKEFENLSVEKRRFRLRWDTSPGLSIAGLFFHRKIFKFFKYLEILIEWSEHIRDSTQFQFVRLVNSVRDIDI